MPSRCLSSTGRAATPLGSELFTRDLAPPDGFLESLAYRDSPRYGHRSPIRLNSVPRATRYPCLACAIRVHHIDLIVAITHRHKSYSCPIGRPVGPRILGIIICQPLTLAPARLR